MKTIIYNIGTLAGILPEGKLKLEGAEMNHVECLNNAYLIIEDGIITEFGQDVGGCSVIQNRATPLAAGGGARDEVVGGVVLDTNITAVTRPKVGDYAVLDGQVVILDAFYVIHFRAIEHSLALGQDAGQCTYIIYDCLHNGMF